MRTVPWVTVGAFVRVPVGCWNFVGGIGEDFEDSAV